MAGEKQKSLSITNFGGTDYYHGIRPGKAYPCVMLGCVRRAVWTGEYMKRLILTFCTIPMLWGCAAGSKAVTADDIASNRYVLQSVDGVRFGSLERTPEISFDDTMRVAGQVCNRFMGQGTLKDSVLTVPAMASTKMLCPDPQLNEMERDFSEMLRQGARMQLDGDTLSLSNGLTSYTFLRDSR